MSLTKLAKRYHAHETVDARAFQPRARLLQAIWREEQGYDSTSYRGKIRGARLPMPWAKETLANYNLKLKPATLTARHSELADAMDCFDEQALGRLKECSLEQIWRDHLLAGAMLEDSGLDDKFDDGFFVFLAPDGNEYCREAVADYRQCLSAEDTFESWTLEGVVEALRAHSTDEWVGLFYDRYLNFSKIDQALREVEAAPVD